MQKQKNFQLAVIGVLAFAVLFMSVGFAAYSQTLTINGTAHVAANKWSVHFVSDQNAQGYYQEAAGSVAATSKTITDTSVTYDVTLSKPGDFYAFTIDVVNDGDFDAYLSAITMSSLTTAQQKYLTHSFKYDNGTPYTASVTGLTSPTFDIVKTTGRKTCEVRVQYVQPESESDLPATAQTISLTVSLDYQQKLQS